MVAQTRTAGQPSPKKLKFHDKLTTKNSTTDALQKKLKALHTELAAMDQETVDTGSFSGVRKELVNTSILLHKDRGVKAYAACCLADLLRLYAPDAPYTRDELRDIFSFFFRQLSTGLKGPDSPYYNEYYHLLESLSTVKSVVLVCDLPNAEDLMTEIFRSFFGTVRMNLAKKIELFMSDILVALIDECQSLPAEVLEVIMAQFMDKSARMEQPAYRLAVKVCTDTADKLQRHVCQYFTDIIVEHSRDEDYEEMQTAHNLIKRLNSACQALLHNVVPQLEEELRVQENQIRVMATQTLGEMFADKGGGDLVRKYPSTWSAWLARKNDQAVVIRQAFVETAKGVLVTMTLPEPRQQVGDALQGKLLDPDDKIRSAVCRLYFQLDYETALHHVSTEQLKSVASRGIDRKPSVQVEAMKAIARLYTLAYPEIENNDAAAIEHFSWIPQSILHMAKTSLEIKALAEQVIADYILPLPAASSSTGKTSEIDEVAWTDRLLTTMKYLDPIAVNTLLSLSGLKMPRPTAYEHYIESCIANNGGIIDEGEDKIIAQLDQDIKRVAAMLPDPQKAIEDLQAFATLNEGRLYKLSKTCMDVQTDIKTLVKSQAEFTKRLDQSSSSLVQTMTTLLRRASLHLVNQSSVPVLLQRIARGTDTDGTLTDTAQSARTWLVFVAKHQPALFKHHVGELVKASADERKPVLIETALHALSAVSKWDAKAAPSDKRTLERLQHFVMDANHQHAKFAARILTCVPGKDEICSAILDQIAEGLSEADPELLAAHVVVLAQLATRVPDAFEERSEVITSYLLKHVIMVPMSADQDVMYTDEEWVEDAYVWPELRARVAALKVFRNRLLARAESQEAKELAKPALKMFLTILENQGSVRLGLDDDPRAKSRVRLQAAISLLRMATVKDFAESIAPNFVVLALVVQDACYQVRITFVNKLVGLLTAMRLPPTYNVVPFLSVHDPEKDVVDMCQAYVQHAVRMMPKQLRLQYFEMMFVRLLHSLAHHPDYALNEEAVQDIAKYIELYLDMICTSENLSLLYHLTSRLKMVRDSEGHTFSEHLYALSELAQRLLRVRAKQHNWPLDTFPGKISLPGGIFAKLPSPEACREIVQTTYLPENLLGWLAQRENRHATAAKEKPKAQRKAPVKRKAAEPKANGHAKKPRTKARKRKAESEEEEDSESEEEDEDEDEDEEEPPRSSVQPSEPDVEEEAKEERLGRGARTRAKAKIKQQIRRPTKPRARAGSDD
ncbi:uncharacterized protein PHACADRAFT_207705 [Phanerochaete carnosa HHB-10118-sp]|uniref:Uncharacterized protein n=1 Tax=Phanerochaete carnosa (strain HHB-10118-sp) TaxID=650164 RepID=K5X144_PHACS|nr:uncharacterized protein PHACADRAFT_207705 [Phanerochaete carnosa HHB-10118-sp]EKM56477.1 hypothetical protein PHACADRAFT_207705 [Phanerochaete carnosa HHB-10118-sp]